jgi:hypothetical protein
MGFRYIDGRLEDFVFEALNARTSLSGGEHMFNYV